MKLRASDAARAAARFVGSDGTAAIQADSVMDDADQLGASHGSCKRAIESSATTIIN